MGSEVSIFLTRSFALGEMRGHGSLVKSTCPLRMELKMPCSDSETRHLSDMPGVVEVANKQAQKRRIDLPAQKGGTPQRRM